MSDRNVAASVRARLLNRARESKQDFNLVLTRYSMERFLYRVSVSAYADQFLLKGALTEQARQSSVYRVWPNRTFEQAAAKFILENQHKRSLHSDIGRMKLLMPWIGEVTIDSIHTATLQPWIDFRRQESAAIGTINHGLKVVRRILNLASTE